MSNAANYIGSTLSSLGDRLGSVMLQRNAEERQRQREDELYARRRSDQLADEGRRRSEQLADEARREAAAIADGLIQKGLLLPANRNDPVAIQAAYEKLAAQMGSEQAARAELLRSQTDAAALTVLDAKRKKAADERAIKERPKAIARWESNEAEARQLNDQLNRINAEIDAANEAVSQQIATGLANETEEQRDAIDAMAEELRRADIAAKNPPQPRSLYRMEAKKQLLGQLVQQQMMTRYAEKSRTQQMLKDRINRLYSENDYLQKTYGFVGTPVAQAFDGPSAAAADDATYAGRYDGRSDDDTTTEPAAPASVDPELQSLPSTGPRKVPEITGGDVVNGLMEIGLRMPALVVGAVGGEGAQNDFVKWAKGRITSIPKEIGDAALAADQKFAQGVNWVGDKINDLSQAAQGLKGKNLLAKARSNAIDAVVDPFIAKPTDYVGVPFEQTPVGAKQKSARESTRQELNALLSSALDPFIAKPTDYVGVPFEQTPVGAKQKSARESTRQAVAEAVDPVYVPQGAASPDRSVELNALLSSALDPFIAKPTDYVGVPFEQTPVGAKQKSARESTRQELNALLSSALDPFIAKPTDYVGVPFEQTPVGAKQKSARESTRQELNALLSSALDPFIAKPTDYVGVPFEQTPVGAKQKSARESTRQELNALLSSALDPFIAKPTDYVGVPFEQTPAGKAKQADATKVRDTISSILDPGYVGTPYGQTPAAANEAKRKEAIRVLLESTSDPKYVGTPYSATPAATDEAKRKEALRILLESISDPGYRR